MIIFFLNKNAIASAIWIHGFPWLKKKTLLYFPFYAISCKEYLLTSRIQTKAFLIKTKINTVKPCNYNFAAKHAILAHY